jgi:hypothetical protein
MTGKITRLPLSPGVICVRAVLVQFHNEWCLSCPREHRLLLVVLDLVEDLVEADDFAPSDDADELPVF